MDIKKIISLMLVLMLVVLVGCKTESAPVETGEEETAEPVVNAVPAPGVDPNTVDEMIVVEDGMTVPGEEADDMVVEDDGGEMMDEELPLAGEDGMAPEVSVPVTFTLTGENFKFVLDGTDNPMLVVNEGDLVRIEFTSTEGFHDWVVDEFSAATEQVKAGGSTFVEFVADKKGSFEYYCSVGSHRAAGMVGTLLVE